MIGTLGNPNFVSSFAAMAILPSLLIISGKNRKELYQFPIFSLFIFAIYRAQSTQGYITLAIALGVTLLVYLWYQNRLFFTVSFLSFVSGTFLVVLGFFNYGP